MLAQQVEEKKKRNDFQSAVGNLKKVVNESKESMTKERSNVTPASSPRINPTATTTRNKSIKDYSIMSPDRQSNGIEADDKSSFDGKKFKSRYIDNNGAWTRESVDDGYVEFKDYIKDRRDGVDFGVSFNDKEFKPKSINYNDFEYNFYNEREYEPLAYDYSEMQSEVLPALEPYTIDENLGETAGVFDGIWSGMKNALKSVDDYRRKRTAEKYYAMVEGIRDFWKWGADILRGDDFKCYSSAWLLEHSLQDNPSDIERGNDSNIAYLINNDKEYLDKLDVAIQNSDGKTLYDDFDVTFSQGDLFYSIHNATMHVEGYKMESGKWFIIATLSDTYDYTEFMTFMGEKWYQFSKNAGLGTAANDLATLSQMYGAINPYEITVEFYTVR